MGLIKASNAPASLTPFSMHDIEQQARAILLRARQQAEQLLAVAQNEAAELRVRETALGFTEGREEGLRAGMEEAHRAGVEQALEEHRSSLTQLITALNAAAMQVEQSRTHLEEQANSQVLRLAIAIAERVTKRQGVLDPSVLSENAVAAIKMVVHSMDLRIAVHPAQKQTLIDALPRLALSWPNFNHVELVEDETLAPGGCRLFTRSGLIDADLDEQLTRIAADLLPAATEAPAESRAEVGGESA